MFRRAMWRLGRRLYMGARGEGPNDMRTNGETWLQRRAVALWKTKDLDAVVLDVGANIGDWTVSLLRQAESAALKPGSLHVHAFEPVPGTERMLRERLSGPARAGEVDVWPIALSDSAGSAMIHVVEDGAGTNSLEGAGGAGKIVEVKKQTIDGFCQSNGISGVDFVKCDTEGHDLFVLHGARKMLSAGQISIFQFEYNFRWLFPGRNLKQVFDFLSEVSDSYMIGRLCPNRVEIFEEWHQELDRFFETNMVILRKDVCGDIPCHMGHFDAANTYA